MKTIAKILTVITLLAIIMYAYVLFTSDAVITYLDCGTAAEGTMDRIRSDINRGADTFVMYEDTLDDDVRLVSYAVRIGNYDIAPFECVGVELTTEEGDVLLYTADLSDVEPFSQGYEVITLATRAQGINRHAKLSYYIHGHYKEFDVELVNE